MNCEQNFGLIEYFNLEGGKSYGFYVFYEIPSVYGEKPKRSAVRYVENSLEKGKVLVLYLKYSCHWISFSSDTW